MKDQQKGSAEIWAIIGAVILAAIIIFLLLQYKAPTPASGTAPTSETAPASGYSFSPLNPASGSFGTTVPTDHQTLGNIPYPSTIAPTPYTAAQTPAQAPVQTSPQQNYSIQTSPVVPVSYVPFFTNTVASQNADYAQTIETFSDLQSLSSILLNQGTALAQSTATSSSSGQVGTSTTSSSGSSGGSNSTGNGMLGGIASMLGGGMGGGGGGNSGGGGGGGSFGGSVTQVTRCTCGPSSLLYINQAGGGQIQLLYTPGQSTLYPNDNVNGTGQQVMGLYTQGGECKVHTATYCRTEGSPQGTISMVGTSAQ